MGLWSYKNPTPLKVGATGHFEGQTATVLGWAALKSDDGYRWEEFQVELADRAKVTLVFERGVWKRFAPFQPAPPLTLRTAAETMTGRMVTVGDELFRVTYVSTSRVLAVEGQMSGEYEVGRRDRYFNAEANDEMVVACWSQGAVECYRGRVLRRGTVEGGFGLPWPSLLSSFRAGGLFHGAPGSGAGGLAGAASIAAVVVLLAYCAINPPSPTADPPPPLAAPAQRLGMHNHGVLAGHQYTVSGHRLVGVADAAGQFSRHEYDLVDDLGGRALLVQALDRNPRRWTLFHAVAADFGPYAAATYARGSRLMIGETDSIVRELFRSEYLELAGAAAESERLRETGYGFVAQTKDGCALARWTTSEIEFMLGRDVPEADVRAALGPFESP